MYSPVVWFCLLVMSFHTNRPQDTVLPSQMYLIN